MATENDLSIAVVCSSNQNRSMEAHSFLSKKGFRVRSFGSGTQVKLPGALPNAPNVYDFGTTYDDMYKDLLTKDKNLRRDIYTQGQDGQYLLVTPKIRVRKEIGFPTKMIEIGKQSTALLCQDSYTK